MPAAPVHHTAVDKTGAWDGPAEEKRFDKVAGDLPKFYAWVDEGEHDPEADGTDKEDGWGPHHETDDKGVPHDANLKGVEAAMAALNGARGTTSRIPDGDRQGVWDHLAAHYKNGGVDPKDIPPLERAAHPHPHGETRAAYEPAAYDDDENDAVTCPSCGRGNAPDAKYCDQCDTKLVGRSDVELEGEVVPDYEPQGYMEGADETVRCPECGCLNDDDAHFCDQCGEKLEGRTDVVVEDDTAEDEGDATSPDSSEAEADDGARARPPPRRSSSGELDAEPLRENLCRARTGAGAIGLRSADAGDTGSYMFGLFSVFDQWYEIDSYWEGTFLESVAPGAYADTIANDRSAMRVLFDHGFDPELGLKPLGPIDSLEETAEGAAYGVPLLDTAYNRDFTLPVLQGRLMSGEQVGSANLVGASMRFIVLAESWEQQPKPSSVNPLGLPQRTITQAQVLEFGPVTFPASPGATAGVRSITDTWFEHLHNDTRFAARATERFGRTVVERMLATKPADGSLLRQRHHPQHPAPEPPDGRASRIRHMQRRAKAAAAL